MSPRRPGPRVPIQAVARLLGWAAAGLALALAWRLYRTPELAMEWMGLLAACFG